VKAAGGGETLHLREHDPAAVPGRLRDG